MVETCAAGEGNMSNAWFESRKQCPACSSEVFRTIYEGRYDAGPVRDYLVDFYSAQGAVEFEYLEGAHYVLCECDVCNLIFQRDIPNDALMIRLYEQWIDPQKVFDHHQKHDDLGYYSYYAQEIMQIIAHIGKIPSSLRFLDFGMGWGKWALMAKAFGCESYGTELSLRRVEYARKNGIEVIDLDETDMRFDFINTDQVFEHIPDPLKTLRHLKMALKPGGMLKISVPNSNDVERRLRIMEWKARKGTKNSLNLVAPLEHINCFRRTSLLKMACDAEMEEVFIPLGVQYRHVTDWSELRRIAKNIVLPVYRNCLKKQNYMFLRNRQPRS